MPFDISGNFTRLHNWQQDRDNGIRIMADRHDEEDDGFADAFNQTMLRTGVAPMTGDIAMGGHKITGIGVGSESAPSLSWELAPSTGFFQPSVGKIAASSGGAQKFEVNADGIRVDTTINVNVPGVEDAVLQWTKANVVKAAITRSDDNNLYFDNLPGNFEFYPASGLALRISPTGLYTAHDVTALGSVFAKTISLANPAGDAGVYFNSTSGAGSGDIVMSGDGNMYFDQATGFFDFWPGGGGHSKISNTGIFTAQGLTVGGASTFTGLATFNGGIALTGGIAVAGGINVAGGATITGTVAPILRINSTTPIDTGIDFSCNSGVGHADIVVSGDGNQYFDQYTGYHEFWPLNGHLRIGLTPLATSGCYMRDNLVIDKTLTVGQTISITGTATFLGLVKTVGILNTGTPAIRSEADGSTAPVGSAGVGGELFKTGLRFYDRTGLVYAPMSINASTHTLSVSSTTAFTMNATLDARFFGTLTSDANATVGQAQTAPALSIGAAAATSASLSFKANAGAVTYKQQSTSPGNAYHDATVHNFRNLAGAATFATMDTTNGLSTISGATASAGNAFLNATTLSPLLRSTSAARYKRNVSPITVKAARKLLDVKPIQFKSKSEHDDPDKIFYGFIAEDVEAVGLEPLVHYAYQEDQYKRVIESTWKNEDGKKVNNYKLVPKKNEKMRPDGVQYERVVVLQQVLINDLIKRIEALEGKL